MSRFSVKMAASQTMTEGVAGMVSCRPDTSSVGSPSPRGRDEQLWHCGFFVDAFRGYSSRIARELERVVAEIEVAAFAR